MDVHDIDQDEECKYFLNTFESIEKPDFAPLLMEILDEPVETILKLINKIRMKINDISTDKVPTIRKFFLEYIPNILQKLRAINNQSLNEYLYEYLVDTIFGQFFCEEVIFRQTARKLVLHLLDRQLLTEAAVEQCVQNVLKSHANDDLPIFMFYITPILGAEQTRKYFWKIFLDVIEGDPGSTVRKQCVRLIAILGSILGQEIIEKDLLPIYIKLSKTSEWAIRKECALELPKISVLCSKEMREQMLTPVMEELLTDANKWVHTAAAEKLGIFIATFAEPELLTLAINADGDLYVVNVADDNENYKDMLSEEKLKNYQFYEDMFAETLIPTGADLGGSWCGIPLSSLFPASVLSPLYHTSPNASQVAASKTIICDSSWNNSSGMDGGGSSGYFLTALDGGEATANERLAASLEKLEEGVGFAEVVGGGKEKDEAEDNPYQKFVNPNFLLNLSSFAMNATSATSPSSTPPGGSPSSSSSPVVTNPFHSLSLFSKKLDRDFHMYNNNNNNSNKINNNNNVDAKEHNLSSSKAEEKARSDSAGGQDSNGNEVAGTDTTPSLPIDPGTTEAEDVFNNNENLSASFSATDPPLDNKTTTMMAVSDAPTTTTSVTESNNNNYPEALVEEQQQQAGSNLEQELAKLTLGDAVANAPAAAEEEEDSNRTSAHLKRATPEGLPNVIKMAIKGKKCKKGLKGLCLPQPPLPMQDMVDEDDNNAKDLSPPQTPSIEDAPTTCPFGGETMSGSPKTPETARIVDLEEEQDLFKAAGDGKRQDKPTGPLRHEDEEQEFYSNNYWYVKPLELTVDELDLIESGGDSTKQEANHNQFAAKESREQEIDLDRNLPPPPPPEDDDDDLPEPVEKRKLFSLYSMKYKSYKLGDESGSGGGGLMSSSMKASRDEMLDNLFSSDSQQSSHLMMVKKSDISPTLTVQKVVPPILLHFYMEMSNFPEWDQICAYSFPAVVLTMGKHNWPLMKSQLQSLCSAIRWEVRQILVASIYQIALIIGREFASQDLVPVFVSFFKDLDNVKIEALHNVAKFLQVIDKRRHIEIVAHLSECLEPENVTNWRFRKDLATEILKLMEIYKNDLEETADLGPEQKQEQSLVVPSTADNLALINEECLKYLTGYALRLLMDRVHSVREVAMEAIVSRMRFCTEAQLWDLIAIIIKSFAQSSHWRRRQIYCQLCETLIQQNAIDMAEFELKMLPPLINMAEDRVPNVRLVVAKCLLNCVRNAYFLESLERRLKLEVILGQLEKDLDRDVREATTATGLKDDSNVEEPAADRSVLDETVDNDAQVAEEASEADSPPAPPAGEQESDSAEKESNLDTDVNHEGP